MEANVALERFNEHSGKVHTLASQWANHDIQVHALGGGKVQLVIDPQSDNNTFLITLTPDVIAAIIQANVEERGVIRHENRPTKNE